MFFKYCTTFKMLLCIPGLNFSERLNSSFLIPVQFSKLSMSLINPSNIFSMVFSSKGFFKIVLTPSHSSIGSSLLSVFLLELALYKSRIITLVQHSSLRYGVSPFSELAERCKGEHPFSFKVSTIHSPLSRSFSMLHILLY